MRIEIAKATTVCLVASSLAGCKLAAVSRCSAEDVIATVKQLGGDGSDDPRLAKLKEFGVEAVVTLDAIRTISSSSQVAVCEGRLTKKLSVLPHKDSDPQPETDGEPARRAQMEQALGLGDATVLNVTYKVEKTDDGSAYVTIIPPDVASHQPEPSQYDYYRQQRMQDQQAREDERERAYQQQRDDQQQQEWRARQEQLEQQELQRR